MARPTPPRPIQRAQPASTRREIAWAIACATTAAANFGALAQTVPGPSPAASAAAGTGSTELGAVTVTGRALPPATIAGWGNTPLSRTPVQASVFSGERLKDDGAQRLADLTRVDPAISDAYNAEGYYDYLTVRGYVLDNQFNFLRDGLPVSAETLIPLDNKAGVEILKGTSGMQAGTSAPGGLVNYVVKRPLDAPLRSVSLEWRQPGTVTGAADISQRFGIDQAFGVRLNAAVARLDSMVRSSQGNRHLLALAADWRVAPDTLIEAEIDNSHRSQPSQPGFSMLGNVVPRPADPRLSLNNQPWSQPVVFDGTTSSLRLTQNFGADWRVIAHAATQRLRTDDRLAYPFGCTDTASGVYYADRYCPNGNFDLYDFRSENERRRTDALDVSLLGKFNTGDLTHAMTFGVLQTRKEYRFQDEAYNYVGTGNVDGTLVTPADPSLTTPNTDRDEHSTELYLRDSIKLTERLGAWLGLRHTRLHRQSIDTEGGAPTDYARSFTTPFAALSYSFARDQMVYASWGQGIESNVVANNPRYGNAGQVFTARSRQTEVGLKGASDALEWNLAAFDIQRPRTQDFGTCDNAGTCTTLPDGTAHNQGIEADAAWRAGPWALRGGAQWLRARVEGSAVAGFDGKQPTNVPARTFKMQADYEVASVRGLNLQGGLAYEGARMVLPDNSATLPGWTRADAAVRYQTRTGDTVTTWRAGVDNLLDRRAWRESPYEYSHVYLYPLAPRTFRLSLQVDL